jgi:hypothetical protein
MFELQLRSIFSVIPGHRAAMNPESRNRSARFSDVQLHIVVQPFGLPRNDEKG